MRETFCCWRCGKSLTAMLPFSRREVCDACNVDQHVCRLCKHYDPAVSDQCREDRAEAVTDKERANFCDYFDPNPNAYQGADSDKQSVAKAKLDALFGDAPAKAPTSDSRQAIDSPQNKNAAAKKALDDLFKSPDADD